MKVLKFSGRSLSDASCLSALKEIVLAEKAAAGSVVVVVSALSDVTDTLISVANKALKGDSRYESLIDDINARHRQMASQVIDNPMLLGAALEAVDSLFLELKSICYGVYLVHDLSSKTLDAVVSYGERVSALIVAAMIDGAHLLDARDFILTEQKGDAHAIDTELTATLIRDVFAADVAPVSVVPGFISRDKHSNETTTLGRGGSDLTAATIAAALDADSLEIWTDVDGFMSADPDVIHNAYLIPQLSYVEATELCNFGAKVIYPPTIYPVCVKDIPIVVRNIFNRQCQGTVIKSDVEPGDKPIKGISSISDTTLITVTGLSMVGVIGVNRRIFSALASKGISVFLVSQASSENSTSIGVKDSDADAAVAVLNSEFAAEIATGAMFEMKAQPSLATVAIVGENMKLLPGTPGRMFGTLSRSGISVVACAQGAAQNNISVVVPRAMLRKAINVIHDSFFLSEYSVLNLFLCGTGVVGGKLIDSIRRQQSALMRERRLKLNVVGIANSRKAIFDRDGIDLDSYTLRLEAAAPCSTARLKDEIIGMNIYNSVFVDCTASAAVADMYLSLLDHNISVVAANKIAASSAYDHYEALKRTALKRGVKFRFETNVGAGLPIINTINDLRNSGDSILKIEAVLSGTLNFIFNEISATVPFSEAIRRAKEQGYSEPDPRIDLSGTDVIRKLVILTREAGYKINVEDVDKHLFLPQDIFSGSVEDFWKRVTDFDSEFEAQRKHLEAEGKRLRFVAEMDHGRASVRLRAVDSSHPFYNLEGSNNIVLLTTECYREYPMQIKGYGAGASVTAVGVFANVMSIANI